MKRIEQAELGMIRNGHRLDAAVRWNPFGEAAKEKQRAKLREYLKVRVVIKKIQRGSGER